jgi:hypothetical protein
MGKNIIGRPKIPPEKMLSHKKTIGLSDIANEALAKHCKQNKIQETEFMREAVLHRLKRAGFKGLDT